MKKINIALIASIIINIVFIGCAIYHVTTNATIPPIAMASIISLFTTPTICIYGIITE